MTAKEAETKLSPCSLCGGKPVILYDPGCSFSRCVRKKTGCPMENAAPDMELDLLVERINAKNGEKPLKKS